MMRDILATAFASPEFDARDRAVLRRIEARQDARDAMVPRDPHAARGFLRIERVASARPTRLFGQSAPSYAHNRIVVCFGETGEDGQTRPGAPAMSALISEESLARLMLSPNRSDAHIALTAESWLGEAMPAWTGGKAHPDDLLEAKLDETRANRRAAVDALRAIADGADRAIPKATREEMGHLLDRTVSAGEVTFRLGRHAENLQRLLVQNRVEASAAALNIDAIARSASDPELLTVDPPDITDPCLARDRNGLLDAAMERFDAEEAEIACRAVRAHMRAHLDAHHPDIDFDVEADDPHGKRITGALTRFGYRGGADDLAEVKRMAILAASLNNPHLASRRDAADGQRLTASCSHRDGGSRHIHSSFPDHDDGCFVLAIHTAEVEESFGNEKIRNGVTVLEVGLSLEDMMTALRGHPTGADIPCSIDHVGGLALDRVHVAGDMEKAISDRPADASVGQAEAALRDLVAEARALIDEGARRVSDRRRLGDLLAEIDAAVEHHCETEMRDAGRRAELMSGIVTDMNREALSAINDHVVAHHGRALPMLEARTADEDPEP